VIATVFIFLLSLVATGTGTAQQPPTEEFNKTFGGTSLDEVKSVIEISDGGFALAGETESFGAGDNDAWLIKTDSNGNEEFNKTFGGIEKDQAWSVIETSDGGFALASTTSSFGAGDSDAWLIKTDSNGNEEFNETFGGTDFDVASSVIETSDGGFALAGGTESFGAGEYDSWLVKTDSEGNEEFNKTFGGTGFDIGASVIETSDDGFALGSYTESFGEGDSAAWLIKTDSEGNEEFNKTFGGTEVDRIRSMIGTSEGGFALAGTTSSFSGGDNDAWLIKTDSEGNEEFNETFGGTTTDTAWSVTETSDGGYALAGGTRSFGTGEYNGWSIKTDSEGNEEFNKTFGVTKGGALRSIVETSDGGFALAGFGASESNPGDALLTKTESAGNGGDGGDGENATPTPPNEEGLPGMTYLTALVSSVIAFCIYRRNS